MKLNLVLSLIAAIAIVAGSVVADDITTTDGQKYENVRDVMLKPNGLFFVTDVNGSMKGVTVPYSKLPDDIKDKYHYDPFEPGLAFARQNQIVILSTNMAFSLATLEVAKAHAKAEKKLLGFIMVWDNMFGYRSRPMGWGSNDDLAHFYDVFHNSMVLVFVHHETELGNVPDAVKQGFFGPDEGGFAPNMAVVTADCSQYICEIPLGGSKDSTGATRDPVFRQKIEVIKNSSRTSPSLDLFQQDVSGLLRVDFKPAVAIPHELALGGDYNVGLMADGFVHCDAAQEDFNPHVVGAFDRNRLVIESQ